MRRSARLLVAAPAAALAVGLLSPVAAGAVPGGEPGPRALPALRQATGPDTVTRLIVHTSPGASVGSSLTDAVADATVVGRARAAHRLADGATLVTLSEPVSAAAAWAAARALERRPDVVSAEPDIRLFPADASPVTPDDPLFGQQWDLWDTSRAAGGYSARVPGAWSRTTGTGQVVAVIDTGITAHPDLDANVLAGYDFVSAGDAVGDPFALTANDGSGRDGDPSDPGDWVTSDEASGIAAGGFFSGCVAAPSSWHGTHVAGTVAAVSDNATGVAGVAPGAKVLAVRALGRCGGYLSDIADAIRWSAGGTVSGVPANPHPAKVINLSLGGSGTCSTYMQNAITTATGLGATVVVAAGNSAQSVTPTSTSPGSTPANCTGVIAVTATTRAGTKASYSNVGTVAGSVAIAAPGGDATHPILSTANPGTTSPAAVTGFDAGDYRGYQGTSMAAPHVAATAALIRAGSANPLSPAQVRARLQAYVTPFPTGSGCTVVACGAGVLDTARAVSGLVQTATLPQGSTLYPYVDGYLDTISVRTLSELSVPGKVRILSPTGSLVREIALPKATTATVTWNGTTTSGGRAPAGTYRAQVLLADRDGILRQVTAPLITVRTSQASTPAVSLSAATVYPVRDGFKDRMRITTKAGVPATFTWRVQKNGKVLWSTSFTRRTSATGTWAGRDRAGDLLPAGAYTLKVIARGGEGTSTVQTRRITVSSKKAVATRFSISPSLAAVARYGGGTPTAPYIENGFAYFPADSVITFTRALPSSVKPHSGIRVTACGRRIGTTRPTPVLGFFSGTAISPSFYAVARELDPGAGCATTRSGPPVRATEGAILRWYVANLRTTRSTWRLDSIRITGTRYVLTG